MTFIRLEHVQKKYTDNPEEIPALDNLSLDLEAGEFLAIMGESGSGKSTLLSILGGLNTPTSGRCLVDDIDLYALGSEQRADFRREYLGFIFQDFHLLPYLTALENVLVPLAVTHHANSSQLEMAHYSLRSVGLENKTQRLPRELSGGEQERVAIARAVVNDPCLLLGDEPTGNLDSRTGEGIMDLLAFLNAQGKTVIMVTHNAKNAARAERTLQMEDGRFKPETI